MAGAAQLGGRRQVEPTLGVERDAVDLAGARGADQAFAPNHLVALAWDSHLQHTAIRAWFAANSRQGWSTCQIIESGFVRVFSNPKVLPSTISVEAGRDVELLSSL